MLRAQIFDQAHDLLQPFADIGHDFTLLRCGLVFDLMKPLNEIS